MLKISDHEFWVLNGIPLSGSPSARLGEHYKRGFRKKNTAKQDVCCETLTSRHTLAVARMNSWHELITHVISTRPVQDQTSQHLSIDEVGAPEARPLPKVLLTFPIFLEERESFFECVQSH